MPLALALLILTASAAAAAPQRTAAAREAASSCPDVAIYGVRGSGEDYTAAQLGMGEAVSTAAGKLLHLLPGTMKVLSVGLPYPAVSAPWAVLNGAGAGPYNNSVLNGAELLVNGRAGSFTGGASFDGLHQLVVSCPNVKIVLIGLSQGAQVITEALNVAKPSMVVPKQIKAIVLFGNPIRKRGTGYDVGTNAHDGALSAPGMQPGQVAAALPSFLWSRTRSYCLLHDPICAFSPQDFKDHLAVHSTYAGSSYMSAGAGFAAAQLLGKPTVTTALPIKILSATAAVSSGWISWTLKTEGPVATGDEPCLHLVSVKPLGLDWRICGAGIFGVSTHPPLPVGGGESGRALVTRPSATVIVYRIARSVFTKTVPRPLEIRWEVEGYSGSAPLLAP